MTFSVSAPRCFIDIYPFEGGKYNITSNDSHFISVVTNKSFRNGGAGSFALTLAPGGPNGINGRPSWHEIVTPFSLVVIGMQRAGYAQIVMIGVVSNVSEAMQRSLGVPSSVQRGITINGEDFTKIFTNFCFYDLAYMLGVGAGTLSQFGVLNTVANALGPASPAQLSRLWFERIMAGPATSTDQPGILNSLTFSYKNGKRISFYDAMAKWFQEYPSSTTIPVMGTFLADQGSWMGKFLSFLPGYWYDFFIQTAPVGYYSEGTNAPLAISMDGFPDASPTIVGRVNPLPSLTASGSTSNPSFTVNNLRWKALPTHSLDNGHGVIAQNLFYSEDEVKNFYTFDPTYLLTMMGASNGSTSPFQLLFANWADVASIHRYGFRPNAAEVLWMSDSPSGAYAQTLSANGESDAFNTMVSEITLRPVSYHEPTPFMLKGTTTFDLRPDILAGNRFTYAPYKDGVSYMFYIETVSQEVIFGKRATTTLTLSRGLKTEEYANTDLLVALHTGNAMRQNGELTKGLISGIGDSLSPINYSTLTKVVGGASSLFYTPQGGR